MCPVIISPMLVSFVFTLSSQKNNDSNNECFAATVNTRHTYLQSTTNRSPAISCRPYTVSHNFKVHAFIFHSATFRSTS